ncbi:hypothetical protein K439DRAFT_282779 [Ramaria rubella]|nr:hypothetical protein K439DRAFT_282779 [Ramaria rubella]
MCNNRSQTFTNQSDRLCNKTADQCNLIRCNGNWKCCSCSLEESRYKMCSAGECTHEICSDCAPRY